MSESFPIIPEKTAVLFFDTLNGGLHPQDPERAATVKDFVDRLVRVERACRDAGITIFYTLPEHRQDGRDWQNNTVIGNPPRRNTFRGTNYKGAPGSTIIPEIAPQDGDYVITKHRWNAFHQTCLELSLRTAGIDTVILAGTVTNIGIASTAYGARDHDFSLIILRDGCRAGDPAINDFFMDRVFPGLSRVMTVDEVIAMLPSRVGSA
jgi:nicotinamidase-related amidase